jgi:hypothetical protein
MRMMMMMMMRRRRRRRRRRMGLVLVWLLLLSMMMMMMTVMMTLGRYFFNFLKTIMPVSVRDRLVLLTEQHELLGHIEREQLLRRLGGLNDFDFLQSLHDDES